MSTVTRMMPVRPPGSFLLLFPTLIALGAASALTSGAHEPRQPDLLLAYVDPGSAGFIITSVLGFLSAFGYTVRGAFGRLTARLRRPPAGEASPPRRVPDTPTNAVPPPS